MAVVETDLSGGDATSFAPGGLPYDQLFHWRVRATALARDGQVIGPWGATSFRTPPAPVVIGVPVPLKYLDGMDSLLSIVQMPAGVPVATVAVGGARNAGLLAVRILAAGDGDLRARMVGFQAELRTAAQQKGAVVRGDSGARRLGF